MIRHFPPPAAIEGRSDAHLPLPDPQAYEGEPREYARALMNRKADIDAEIVGHSFAPSRTMLMNRIDSMVSWPR
jgi:hypothetical protein